MFPRAWFRLAGLSGVLMVLALVPPGWAQKAKGKQYAFLVACSDYQAGQFRALKGTIAEMKDFRQALIDSGFDAGDVVFLHDRAVRRYLPEKAKILKELGLLLARLEKEDTLVVALNGHGLHFKGDKVGYFVPLDGRADNKSSLVPMDGKRGLFETLKECRAGRRLLLVNACRHDPLDEAAFAATRVKIDDEDGAEVPEGIAALYSCRKRQKSYEYPRNSSTGKPGRSLFYHHVIEAWKGKYAQGKPVTLEHLFSEVRVRTSKDASDLFGESQVPDSRREYHKEWALHERLVVQVKKEITSSIGMKLVLIPAGKFEMGSPKDEKGRDSDEKQHEVEITKPFYLGVCEVTQKQFQSVMGYNPSYFSKDGKGRPGARYDNNRRPGGGKAALKGIRDTSDFPVENVSWEEASAFCKKLSEREKGPGRLYRLPTEAEWEYACRGGASTRPYHLGASISTAVANFGSASTEPGAPGRTVRVASYRTTHPFGLCDMHGNVAEWCGDWYDEGYHARGPIKGPRGPSSGSERVHRGGSWHHSAEDCRSAARSHWRPGVGDNIIGFRVALEVPR